MLIWQQQWAVPSSVSTSAVRFVKPVPVYCCESIKDEFMQQLVAATKTIKLGDPKDSTTTMGPVINERQFDRIQGYIQAGQTEGAKLIGGSGRYPVEGFEQGLFVQPTIF